MFLFKIGFIDIHWLDILDVLLVTGLLYNLYNLLKGSIALKILVGFLAIYLVYLVVRATEMALLTEILGQFMGVGVIAILILFQNEIRRFLLLVGRSTDLQGFFLFQWRKKNDVSEWDLTGILEAMQQMASTKTGVLLVISKKEPLDDYASSGDLMDAKISKRLLMSIFFKNAPLHDGAVILHKNRIVAARCILPVSQNPNISPTLGLRHRAGIGMTEATDVVVLIVSEETGRMSFIHRGEVFYNLKIQEIQENIISYLEEETFVAPQPVSGN